MQKHVNLVDLVKSFPTNIYLQNLASIQKRTSPLKFAHLAEKSEKGSTSNLSTKVRAAPGAAAGAGAGESRGLSMRWRRRFLRVLRRGCACAIKLRRQDGQKQKQSCTYHCGRFVPTNFQRLFPGYIEAESEKKKVCDMNLVILSPDFMNCTGISPTAVKIKCGTGNIRTSNNKRQFVLIQFRRDFR